MNITEKFWDRQSYRFDKEHKKLEKLYIKTIGNTKKYLTVSDIVLDYGCGTGAVAIEIAGNVKEIQGIDISSKMIQAAQRKAAERRIENLHFAQATIFDERLGKESFDAILAMGILHLLKDPQKAIKRINELLKPGGFFVSSTACMGEDEPMLEWINRFVFILSKIGITPHLGFLKASELERSITNENFNILESESLAFDQTHDPSYVFARFIVAMKEK